MFVLDGGTRVVVPRTELTYPGHNMKLHTNAASAEKTPVDHVMADLEDACPYEFKGDKSRATMVEALNTLDFGKKVITNCTFLGFSKRHALDISQKSVK